MKILAPSILSADFSALGKAAADVEAGGAGLLHIDVMDGHFVPNISFGAAVMKSLLGKTNIPFDVHLMIEDPDKYIDDFATDNTQYITVHQEACTHLNRTLQHIDAAGAKRGVSLNPATPLCMIEDVLDDVDLVLLDWIMPKMNGREVMTAMHVDEELMAIPVIFLSAYHAAELDCLKSGALDFIPKPFPEI
ncbi:MAG: response regulator, partial [Anaerovoracaceae bacterium]|nr:response regulator [Anaerovoracaceae bacterium]